MSDDVEVQVDFVFCPFRACGLWLIWLLDSSHLHEYLGKALKSPLANVNVEVASLAPLFDYFLQVALACSLCFQT